MRSDIFSFGLVLWQIAAGSQVPPFAVGVAPPRSPQDFDRYKEIYERQVRKRAPALEEPLQGIIERCLAADPSERFASFTQLRSELEPLLNRRAGRTIKLLPVGERSALPWNNKGLSLLHLGRLEEAESCLRKGLEIDPNDVRLHNNLGLVLQDKGDLHGAIAEYHTALRLQPDLASAHNNLGLALQTQGAYSGASCPLIPVEVVHRFRRKLSSDSGAMLSTFSPERNRWTPSRNEWTPSRNLSE